MLTISILNYFFLAGFRGGQKQGVLGNKTVNMHHLRHIPGFISNVPRMEAEICHMVSVRF